MTHTVDTKKGTSKRFNLRLEDDRSFVYRFAAKLEGRPLANWMKHHLDQVAEVAIKKNAKEKETP